jgi:hypothetical protein
MVQQAALDRELVIEAEEVGEEADPAMALARVLLDVDAVHDDAAGGGRVERGDAAQQRRLAGPVRPDQRRDAARLDGEGNPVERPLPGIVEDEAVDGDEGGHSATDGGSRVDNPTRMGYKVRWLLSSAPSGSAS